VRLSEAYKLLELSEGATPEEAKKQYRKLSKAWHPDINKAPEAESKFKLINEAYQCVQNGKGNEREDRIPSNPFYRQQTIQLENVELNTTISFKEAVLGCKKDLKYSRKAKCPACEGSGETQINNGCAKCGGKGRSTISQGGMVFISVCSACQGRTSTEDCKTCQAEGSVQTDVSINVSIPAGILDGNVLRLQGMGNYAGSVMGIMDQYTDAFCHIAVISEPGLSIEGKNVVSSLNLSLLEVLTGCKKEVKTIDGVKEVIIPERSRHNEEVLIPKLGVAGVGDQKVILNVEYPNNIDKLIQSLTEV